MRKIKAGFMFLELLLVLAIIIFVGFKVFKLYSKNYSINQETQKVTSEQGIDTASHRSTLDSARDKLQDLQDKHFDDLGKI